MEQYEDKILDHNYDGIQEYDNPMPGWWKALFALTIVWAAVYLVGIELNVLPRYQDDLKSGQAELLAMRQAHEKTRPPIIVDDAMLTASLTDSALMAKGKEVFSSTCSSCHGSAAQGGIGPNLTDDFWLYGQKPLQIHTTISKGTPKGMPPWDAVLQPEELVALVVYISSTRGSNPEGAKEPQGDRYDPPGSEKEVEQEKTSGEDDSNEDGKQPSPSEESGEPT